MTLKEAIIEAESRSRNVNLHWFVSKWNEGYIIHSSNYMKRFPNTEYVYSTGQLNKFWDIVYDKDLRRFIHVIKKIK